VPNPTNAAGCVTYIQNVLINLNTPGTNLNGDTFDTSLSQDEDQSALEFLPANSTTGDLTFNFAVARVRIKSTVTETTPVMRVFFRLFQAASTVSNFIEVGTGEGTYRWGTNGYSRSQDSDAWRPDRSERRPRIRHHPMLRNGPRQPQLACGHESAD
jgi:hypothetical protein